MWKLLRKIIRTGILTEKIEDKESSIPSKGARRSLAIRHVDAGSCNGCELELWALENPYYSLSSGGIKFVASPRHADLLLVTGPVSLAMREALLRTHEAVPKPRQVMAVGDCACSGGIFTESYAVLGGVEKVMETDIKVPGCPPAPEDLIRGIRQSFGKISRKKPPAP